VEGVHVPMSDPLCHVQIQMTDELPVDDELSGDMFKIVPQ
jgi:hypothetical protein